mmetsp:Transcript_3451/g.7624  ORF Transcript_3451/g.7624 Transcript_3451/m.7624 type:complete len:202 (+) Transcript_3451:173-778(+)
MYMFSALLKQSLSNESQPSSSLNSSSLMNQLDERKISFTSSESWALPSSLSVKEVLNNLYSFFISSGSASGSLSSAKERVSSAPFLTTTEFMIGAISRKATAAPESSSTPPKRSSLRTPSNCPIPDAIVPVATITSVAPALIKLFTESLSSERTKIGVSGKASRKHAVARRQRSTVTYVIAMAVGFSTPAALMSAPDAPSP